MSWLIFEIVLIFGAAIDWTVVRCARQYDVESEAIKLFGEDLSMVLKRFRRTPEYLAILDERVNEMRSEVEDVIAQVRYAYSVKVLPKYVNETLNEEDDKGEIRERAESFIPPRRFARGMHLRQEAGDGVTSTPSPVERLDSHAALHSMFSVAEKNGFKDTGFKVAGLAIHKIIASVGSAGDEDLKSTRMPSDSRVTTEHASVHGGSPTTAR